MSVKVGVRVRPFNKRQKQLNCKCCVEMVGSTTHVHMLDGTDQKSFVFDYSFWSHDKFETDDNGIYYPIDNKYADQKKVYNQIGSDILINAWQGYNCCLFAYGQTGSGKSYSMLGYGVNKGVIPMVCDNIFDKISKDKDKSHGFQVKVSMLEIYNETLRDLLSKQKKSKQLKIKQTKKTGVYVQGLVKSPVSSYQQIAQKIQQGSNNRSIAATLMNQSSSRSHTIVCIQFIQKIQISIEQTSIKFSTIYLVDLAGSQSVGKTGVDSKDRLREAAKINQSLSTLGRVIEILAQNSGKSQKQKTFVPYRDSKLTLILRNALGGNSRTAMICAISPANDNYEQTLSTLRYASRAKKIKNKAIVNESDVDKIIRQLRQQNEMLKQMLKQARLNKKQLPLQLTSNDHQQKNGIQTAIGGDDQIIQDQIMGAIQQDDKDNLGQDDKDNLGQDDKDNVNQFQNNINILEYNQKIDQSLPYITNLNQDQLLTRKVKYSCSKELTIGNKQGVPRPNVVLSALGILPLHCIIKNQQGRLFIQIIDEQASEYTYVNGKNTLTKNNPIELMNCDRLIFGTQCVFLVQIQNGEIRKIKKDNEQKQIKVQDIDYQYAILEQKQNYLTGGINNNKIKQVDKVQQQQMRKKVIDQIQQQFIKMKQVNQEENKKKLEEQQIKFKLKMDKIQKQRLEEVQKFKLELEKQARQASQLRDDKQKSVNQLIVLKQMQKKLQQNNTVDKQALQKARRALDQKKQTINALQKRIQINTKEIKVKQIQMKEQMQKKQKIIQKQLYLKNIRQNNQNILNNYQHEEQKKLKKKKKQLKDILIKSQKNQMESQLFQLLPMVQKFNLISKQMKKNIQCKLSINYQYISQCQYLQKLQKKTKNTKQPINYYFLIKIINRNQNRCYSWSVDTFKYRYQIAQSIFNLFSYDQKQYQKLNAKEKDPYWDPPTPQVIGFSYVLLQSLFNQLGFDDKLSIVKKGKKIGKIHIKIYPIDPDNPQNDLSIKTMQGIMLYDPRNFVQNNLCFKIQLNQLVLHQQNIFSNLQVEYQLLDKQYKKQIFDKVSNFSYKNTHILKDLSQSMIQNYMNKPICIKLLGDIKQTNDVTFQLFTQRDNQQQCDQRSIKQSITENQTTVNQNYSQRYLTPRHHKPSDNIKNRLNEKLQQIQKTQKVQKIQKIQKVEKGSVVSKCGILVNDTVMGQIDKQYNEKKQKVKSEKKKKKKQDCTTF